MAANRSVRGGGHAPLASRCNDHRFPTTDAMGIMTGPAPQDSTSRVYGSATGRTPYVTRKAYAHADTPRRCLGALGAI